MDGPRSSALSNQENGDGRATKREQREECPEDVDLDEQTQSSNEGSKRKASTGVDEQDAMLLFCTDQVLRRKF